MQRAICPSLASALLAAAVVIPTAAHAEAPAKVKVTISRETTCITEPLNPDGTPNYVAAVNALCGKGVTPDNNAAVLLLEALGPEMLMNKDTRAQVYRLLGIPPPPADGAYFVPFQEYARSHPPEDEETGIRPPSTDPNQRISEPWHPKDDPLMAGWIQANARALDGVVSASRRERMFVPLVSPSDPPTLYDCFHNSSIPVALGRALAARGMLRLGQGQVEPASADILALHRLGVLASQGPMLIDVYTGIAVDAAACLADNALARSGSLTVPQLRHHLAAVVGIPEVSGVTESCQGPERFFQLDLWILCARKSVRKVLRQTVASCSYPLESLPDYPLDWDEALRMQNAHLDRLVAAGSLPTFRRRSEAVKALKAEIDKIVGPDKKAYAQKMVRLVNARPRPELTEITPATFYYLQGCCDLVSESRLAIEDRGRAFRRIAVVSLALAGWRAEKGSYPDRLDVLSPGWLKAVPQDPFTDKPLIYRRQGEGYVLYSVGANMIDEGGVSGLGVGADDINMDPDPE